MIDLVTSRPRELVAEASLDDLYEAAKSVEAWSDRAARVLDYVYRQRLVAVLEAPGDTKSLRALAKHLRKVAHPVRAEALDALAKPYASIWLAYARILESRVMVLDWRKGSNVRSRKHVEDILQVIRSGKRTQGQIQDVLGLKKANLSRILRLMEASKLIVRHRLGRENRVDLHPAERRRSEQTAPETGRPGREKQPSERRGIDFLVTTTR